MRLILLSLLAHACAAVRTCMQYGTPAPSQFGVLCDECTNLGYVDEATARCVCYGRDKDPLAQCAVSELVTNAVVEEISFDYEKMRARCSCFADDVNGWHKSVNETQHKYGTPNPPVCGPCVNDGLGPSEGNGEFVKTCTQVGSPDPVALHSAQHDAAWKPCGGHGIPNDDYTCTCFKGWKSVRTGLLGRNSTEEVYSCIQCADGYGPPVAETIPDVPPSVEYCSRVWTPDPLTGYDAECGGHGTSRVETGCDCHCNVTVGCWRLVFEFGVFTCSNQTELP